MSSKHNQADLIRVYIYYHQKDNTYPNRRQIVHIVMTHTMRGGREGRGNPGTHTMQWGGGGEQNTEPTIIYQNGDRYYDDA